MREMILNEISFVAPDVGTAAGFLTDVAKGMATLVAERHVHRVLRSRHEFYSIMITESVTLYDVLLEVRRQGRIDEYRFFTGLAVKTPLLASVSPEIVDRFLGCEAINISGGAGEPLVFCAHTNGVGVSFPSSPTWDSDRVLVHFRELLPNDSFEEVSEEIDNLSRTEHANNIAARAIDDVKKGIQNGIDLWNLRARVFPSLLFGPDVESQICDMGSSISTIVNRLAELNESVSVWQNSGGTAPLWRCKVSPESASVENNPILRDARRFRSIAGSRELFMLHARFGNSGRIHMRIDSASRSVEVGYIGPHLPL
jgi:hypothetical protein